ncbi:ATP-dependent DNA ligase [Nocardia stercoris]|uniref:DNA ligase (ATP) n=1 Tax=Nocardia stercoris TaxID=2483361 RepID=A0A3M2KWS3_9NOCA|nr:ATP-dependent DNA ligase [Nocardia stercoris]RMI29681.1 ATP-dependent DNA ligase [Nocardia stercoris]
MATREYGGIEVAVSNLDKVLYPSTGTTKGEVVDYFVAVAAGVLPHIAGRPVTRKRWPNGVDQPSFFEKNLAAHVPSWLPRRGVVHSDRRVTYPLIDSVAGLAWLGQQAALEIHVPQWRFDADGPGPNTRLVFDLDPGPGAGLAECAAIALAIRDTVHEVGLRAYPVTSGSKGIHVYVPLDNPLDATGASTVAKQVATGLQQLHPGLVTASMAKSARTGKIFLDWSQNNPAKTTIAPYSLRGREHPTVAAPRAWSEIEAGDRLRQLTFDEVLTRFRADGDLLDGLDPALPRAADPLDTYRSMRDPRRTPEPVPAGAPIAGPGNRFVVQEHHARRLHWDVRLERDGVLVSWAVPKGPPTSPKQNRLAVHTEDHPLEYLDFHGTIPRGEYGGGEMTIWDRGTYETEKWRDDEVIVRFHGERLDGRYAFIQTSGTQWLMHLMKPVEPEPAAAGVGARGKVVRTATGPAGAESSDFPRGLRPMLATAAEVANLDDTDWAFEIKWDGFRLIGEFDRGTATLRSRAGNVVTDRYPRIAASAAALAGHRVVLDGEAVVLDDQGLSNVALLQSDPARAVFVVFDVLYLDGTSLIGKRYSDRRMVLEALAASVPELLVPDRMSGPGATALDISRELGQEGVVAKRLDSTYQPGRRSQAWIKTRNWRTQEVVIGGWRRSPARPFASLLVGIPHEGTLQYIGRVGTGFSERQQQELSARMRPLERKTSPFDNDLTAEEIADAVWVTPKLTGLVRFMNWTDAGRLWHPAWVSGGR